MPTLQQKRLLIWGGWLPVYLLRDDFTTAASAPLTSPRTAEPGPGTLTLVQTDGQFSIANGKLGFPAQATATWGDQGFYRPLSIDRVSGRATITLHRFSAFKNIQMLCWFQTTALNIGSYYATIEHSIGSDGSGTINLINNASSTATTISSSGAISNSTDYSVVIVLRTAGAFFFIKGGIYTNWSLLWIDTISNDGVLSAGFSSYDAAGTLDTFRVLDLPAPFDTNYGLATQRLAGARSAGDTFTHEADCIIEWTQTTVPSAGQTEMRFRIQDATNYWQVTVDSTGALDLDEVVAGTPTQRGTAAGVIANGDRIVVIANGTTIRVYEASVLRITYASATNFQTATAGELETEGTGGSVSEIIAWPRTLTGNPAAILDQVSA